jgi:hypothetical protein
MRVRELPPGNSHNISGNTSRAACFRRGDAAHRANQPLGAAEECAEIIWHRQI